MDILEKRALFHANMRAMRIWKKMLLAIDCLVAVACMVLNIYHAWIGDYQTALWYFIISLLCFILACKNWDYIQIAVKFDDAVRTLDKIYDDQKQIEEILSESDAEAAAEAEPQKQ